MTTGWAYEAAGCTEKFSVSVGEAGSLWSDGEALFHKPRGGEIARLVDPPTEDIETIPLSVLDFVSCLREGRRPINTEVEGIEVLKVILAAYASADEGRAISIPEQFPS